MPEAHIAHPRRGIPSLDGWRGVSILLVLALHSIQGIHLHLRPNAANTLVYTLANGAMGVRIFFVISGYLITRLLLIEQVRSGHISLGHFYLRRVFRILPPLYLYLATLLGLIYAGRLFLAPKYSALAAAFLTIYTASPDPDSWTLEHTWSLCVEEQFYLLWPFLLVWTLRTADLVGAKQKATRLAILGIAVIAILRIPWSLPPFTSLHFLGNAALQLDGILFGAFAAVAEGESTFERWYQFATKRPWVLGFLLFGISSWLENAIPGKYIKSIGAPVDGLLIMWLLLWTVRQPQTQFGRILNWGPLAKIGVLSYSLYLWQTLFLHAGNERVLGISHNLAIPLKLMFVFIAGSCSFFLVEKPVLAFRDKVFRPARKTATAGY